MAVFPDSKVIGKRLRDLRGENTLEYVANGIGVTTMAVSLWERGERVPNDVLKVKLANFFSVPVSSIFFTQ